MLSAFQTNGSGHESDAIIMDLEFVMLESQHHTFNTKSPVLVWSKFVWTSFGPILNSLAISKASNFAVNQTVILQRWTRKHAFSWTMAIAWSSTLHQTSLPIELDLTQLHHHGLPLFHVILAFWAHKKTFLSTDKTSSPNSSNVYLFLKETFTPLPSRHWVALRKSFFI